MTGRTNRFFGGFALIGGGVSLVELTAIIIRGRDLSDSPIWSAVLSVAYLLAIVAAAYWRSLPDRDGDGVPDRLQGGENED